MTRAASKLHTSQPGISKQIKLFEEELGLELLKRGSHKIVGLTPAGLHIVEIARRMLADARTIKSYGKNAADGRSKRLTVSTTHLFASYVFPTFIAEFHSSHPDVELVLRNGEPKDIIDDVVSGRADLGLTATVPDNDEHLMRIPGYQFGRTLIMPKGHPLSKRSKVSLEDCAKYPLITYCQNFAGSTVLTNTFERHGLNPNITIRTMDTESIKKYVKLGLGISILQSVAVEAGEDPQITELDVTHLFGITTASILVRPSTRINKHFWKFIEKLEPGWDRNTIRQAMKTLQDKATGTCVQRSPLP